jgi:hypothetical protein
MKAQHSTKTRPVEKPSSSDKRSSAKRAAGKTGLFPVASSIRISPKLGAEVMRWSDPGGDSETLCMTPYGGDEADLSIKRADQYEPTSLLETVRWFRDKFSDAEMDGYKLEYNERAWEQLGQLDLEGSGEGRGH